MDSFNGNNIDQNCFRSPTTSGAIYQQIHENGTSIALNETDLQFLISNNFVILDLENLQNNIVYERIEERPSSIRSQPSPSSFLNTNVSWAKQFTPEKNSELHDTNTSALLYALDKPPQNIQNETEIQSSAMEKEVNKTSKIKNKTKIVKTIKRKKKIVKANREQSKNSIKCKICDQIFDDYKTLRLHKRTVHALKKSFRCEKCLKEFNFEVNFIIHTAIHRCDTLKCPICDVKFQRQSSFHGHLKNHIENDNFKCDDCDEEFEFEEYYKKHRKDHHNECDNDDEKGTTSQIILKKRKHTGSPSSKKNRKHECTTCGMKFTKPAFLRRHQVTHTNLKPYECFECSKRFTQKASLERHQLVHTGERPFTCSKCSMKFSQKSNLFAHRKRVHEQITDLNTSTAATQKFPCKDCSCVFNKLNALNSHRSKMHTSVANNQLTDDIDVITINNVMNELKSWQKIMRPQSLEEKDFKEELSVMAHNEINPSDFSPTHETFENSSFEIHETHEAAELETVMSADNAGEMETRKLNYRSIKHEIIDGVRYFACVHCDKKTKKSNDMLRHIRTHTQTRDYKCEKCGRCFSLRHNLNVHRKIHERENEFLTPSKLYHCYICSELFDSLKRLDLHIKSKHSNQNLFKCSVCDKSFRDAYYLRIHTLNHFKAHSPDKIDKSLLEPIYIGPLDAVEKRNSELEQLREYQCIYCGLRFKRMYHLLQHEKTHSNDKSNVCDLCGKKFSTMNSLANHRKLHLQLQTKRFKCHICNASFTAKSNLKRHIHSLHINKKYFKCRYCEKTFKMKEQCRRHSAIHFKNVIEDCTTGENNDTVSEQSLAATFEQYDVVASEKSSAIAYNQENCNIPNETAMNMEMGNFQINFSNDNVVGGVEEDFAPLYSAAVQHNLRQQPEDHAVIEYAVDALNSLNVIPNHEEIETCTLFLDESAASQQENEPLPFGSFEESLLLSNQELNVNGEATQFQQNASKIFKLDNSFEKNVPLPENIVHEHLQTPVASTNVEIIDDHGTKPPPKKTPATTTTPTIRKVRCSCSFCGKGFQKPNDLVRHMRMHTNDKPFKCDICSAAFTVRKTLNNHIITHNENRSYYDCNVCGKKYASVSILKVHLRIHTGERPYQCEYCSQSFRTSGHRTAHVKAHHKTDNKMKMSGSVPSKRKAL